MLKNLQQKLVLIFVLIILAIMLVMGTFLFDNITSFYHNDFKNNMETAFNENLITQLNDSVQAGGNVENIKVYMQAYTGMLGIDSYRHYYILDGKTGVCLYGETDSITITSNISTAMTGKIGDEVVISNNIMEYALPVPQINPPQFIIYIVDEKVEMTDFINNMLKILLQSLILGVLISVILGYFLSKTITTPITGLTKHAEKLATGEFEKVSKVDSNDEIGILSNTFKYMSETLYKTLEEIAFEKNKLETVMQYMNDGIIAFDADGKILVINPSAKNLLGITNENELSFDTYFATYFDDLFLGDFIYIYNDKKEERSTEIGGRSFNFYFSTFRFDEDKYSGIMVVISDITKQANIEKSRREFVANVSHELKTPITTVKSYVETIMENDLEKEMQNSFLAVVNKEADRMTRLIQDLLTLSRLDNNMILSNRSYFDLSELIRDIINNISIEAQKYKHQITYHEMNELPHIYMDRDRLEQILVNIISNSIKYTPNGGKIAIFVRASYGNVCIKVKDNGIGIPKEDLERIFERFYRVDKARSREQGGTGLGLAITKEMLNIFGGEIFIDSEQNVGTEACIVLPVDGVDIDNNITNKQLSIELFEEM